MKNFPLADSSKLMAVRLILASWALRARWRLLNWFRLLEPKNVWLPLSRHDVRQVDEKFSSRRFERAFCCLTHFGLLRAKTFDSYFLGMMYVELRRVHEKFSCQPIRASRWLLDSFRSPEPKSVWFLLSRHDVRRVQKNFPFADSNQLMAVRLILASWGEKRLTPSF